MVEVLHGLSGPLSSAGSSQGCQAAQTTPRAHMGEGQESGNPIAIPIQGPPRNPEEMLPLGIEFSSSAIRKSPLHLPFRCSVLEMTRWWSGLEASAWGVAWAGQPACCEDAFRGVSLVRKCLCWTRKNFPGASRALQPSHGENCVFHRRIPWRHTKRCPCGRESQSGCCPSLGTSGEVSVVRTGGLALWTSP